MTIDDFVRTGVLGAAPNVPSLFGTGVTARRLDGAQMRTVDDLLDAFAQAWDFPDHFGFNRDALDDCMRDLPDDLRTPEGTASTGYLTIVLRAEQLLADEPSALDWFAESTQFWHDHHSARGRRFATLLVGDTAAIGERWADTGVRITDVVGGD